MVLVHEYSLPGRILARRAVTMAAGGVEQQPPVGETPLLARSPAISSISLAFQGASSGHAKPDRRPADQPEGSWDIRDKNDRPTMLRGPAVIHHLAIFSVDIENLPAVESPKVSYDVVSHASFELDVMCFDRPSTTLRTIELVELDWAAQGLLPRSRRTSSCWRRRGPPGPRRTCPPAPSRRPFLLGIRSLSMYIDAIPWLVPGGAA